uniref:RING-type domain-containing protein n=1 Tax=Monopterus albus TaxID=43700 RepID=A0A3Q3QK17_MONAL
MSLKLFFPFGHTEKYIYHLLSISHIPRDTKKEATQRMKICSFWLPILLQREESNAATCWAVEIGLISSKDHEDLSLKQLHKIETVEAILRALEKGSLIGSRSSGAFEDALYLLERTEELDIRGRIMEFGHMHTCHTVLHFVFTECKMQSHYSSHRLVCYWSKSEGMKKKGNESFQKQQYDDAVRFYTKAIKYYPDNHIIYGNRGHYRYCEALFSMGEVRMAVEANCSAQILCREDHEGFKDLEQQHSKFITEMAEGIFMPFMFTPCITFVFYFFEMAKSTQKVAHNKASVCKELRSVVQDAHTALADFRSRNAQRAFSQALAILETNAPKLFYVWFLCVTQELAVAQRLLEKMKSFEERTFQCLVYYAIGRVFLKENRFAVALEQFSDSLQMVKNQITPGKLTWPLTKEIVKETQPDYFKEILESAIELCKFPPIPDAICRLEKCVSHLKAEIYFTDPDFKGFIQLCCCERCTVEYHIACWKALKTSAFSEKNEKDFLQEACLTPDCVGQICIIKIFGPTGLMKCKFEANIPKPQTPKMQKVNQKCTSLKKLKSKEERKLKRKQHKASFQENQVINDEIVQKKEDSASQTQDHVLLQISQNMELLREEMGLHVSILTSSLKPWLQLDLSRGNQLAGRMLNWQQEPLETLGQAVELLLERKNRVWARVLIQLLSSCLDVNPKLNNWASKLNDAGLNAAKSFIERYAAHLEQLNLDLLLNFGPLQEMIIEKLGTRPELFLNIGFTVTEYLKRAPPHDMRLFIWTLEEHRDHYLSCQAILDEYFDMMVLKKSDENQNVSQHFVSMGVIVFSGMRGVTPRNEVDQDLFDDNSLSFLHPADPFSVPSHLREQVADFEDQYNSTRHRRHYKQLLDNNPDPTRESLYDYFAQILEEHGPLVAEDPLLVGELENFPQVAQLKIQEAGGFESFLLESLRFIKMGSRIGLAQHAVSLQQAVRGAGLDDLDVLDAIGDSDTNCPSPYSHETDFTFLVTGFCFNLMHKEDLSSLEEDIEQITVNIQVTNKELVLFQQKLEEEVKKDQKEKKANQEVLKSLKTEIEKLVEEHGSNQSAAEKMSLEDEIKRCKALLTSASRRSLTAQVGPSSSCSLNMEDPCIICHDDMSPDTIFVLECRHSFHKECIRSWLKEQSTCPTCRDHALLPEDFPVLTGRRHQAP